MRKKVFITKRIPDVGLNMLSEFFEVEIYDGEAELNRDKLIELIRGCFGLVSMVSDIIDAEIVENFSGKIIANYGVGYNNVDIGSATAKGIFVTNTPDVLSQATAELAWSLVLAASRFHYAAGRYLREGKFRGFEPLLFLGKELYGSTLGIIGMGRIGSLVARMGRFGFGMKVLYHNRRKSDKERMVDAEYVDLNRLLRESDVVVVTSSFGKGNKHMIGRGEFSAMKKDVVFVNVSRGEVVDTDALVWALKNGILMACGLDVYENEPMVDRRLLGFDNCVLLPHIGSATLRAREEMSKIVANNIISVYKGECPETSVNGEELCRAGILG